MWMRRRFRIYIYLLSLFRPLEYFGFLKRHCDFLLRCLQKWKLQTSKFPCNRILLIFVVSNLSWKLAVLFWFKAQLFSWYLVLTIAKKGKKNKNKKHAIRQEKSNCPVIMNIFLNILDWFLYNMIQWIPSSQGFPCCRNTKAKLAS